MTEKKVTMTEIRKTIGTSLGTAFGIVIGMIWTNVVLGAFTTAGARAYLITILGEKQRGRLKRV